MLSFDNLFQTSILFNISKYDIFVYIWYYFCMLWYCLRQFPKLMLKWRNALWKQKPKNFWLFVKSTLPQGRSDKNVSDLMGIILYKRKFYCVYVCIIIRLYVCYYLLQLSVFGSPEQKLLYSYSILRNMV